MLPLLPKGIIDVVHQSAEYTYEVTFDFVGVPILQWEYLVFSLNDISSQLAPTSLKQESINSSSFLVQKVFP